MARQGRKGKGEWNATYTGKDHHGENFGGVRYPGGNGQNGMGRMGGGGGGLGADTG